MKHVVVTGGSGRAGRAVVRDLLDHGYIVRTIDIAAPETPLCAYTKMDLGDLGQTTEALSDADGVVHLAAVAWAGLCTEEATFRINVTTTYNVFRAAVVHGLRRVVYASTDMVFGSPFDRQSPAYAPVDEAHPLFPEQSYALSKAIGEELAGHFTRWHPGLAAVGLRFSNIKYPEDYREFPGFWDDPSKRKWNLWGYVDVRDVGQACRLALEVETSGAEIFNIAARDTVMNRPSRELMSAVFPETPVREMKEGFQTLLSIEKAGRILGYSPVHSWREYL